MKRRTIFLAVGGIALATAGGLRGTGYYGPDAYLDRGGANVYASPEFYWDMEVKRLARDFSAPEKFHPVPSLTSEDPNGRAARMEATAKADTADFAAALAEGRIKPPDPALAVRQHEAARALLQSAEVKSTAALPEEFASEFSDYHRGALAYARGPEHWEEARQAWTALLARPETERHYRTLWAKFMLAKLALKEGKAEATALFAGLRETATAGFADSLGLAADSYGWQGRSEWKQGHPAAAAALFLTQLSLGDESAVVSLKALIPDRAPVDGMLNYGPENDERLSWTEEQKRAQAAKEQAALQVAARDPLLRRLVTVHVLATATAPNFWGEDTGTAAARSQHWLAEVKAAKVKELQDAEYLGWAAYHAGEYKEAERWLTLAGAESAAALWLRAKLELRAGKTADAARHMAAAWEVLREPFAYTGWRRAEGDEGEEGRPSDGPRWLLPEAASGDLAALRLERGDFVQAFQTFARAGLDLDAGFVAERVLTLPELQRAVEELPAEPDRLRPDWRDVLGRRLVRADRYEEAAKYLRPPNDQIVARYAQALREGAEPGRPKEERAAAWFHAAWLARYDGMELMGTEVAPDGSATGGSFPVNDLARERLTGKYEEVSWDGAQERKTARPIPLRPSGEELQRLQKNKITPDVRFHYRLVAGALAMKAAELLPDQTEALADVINTAGNWVKDRDEKTANKYFAILDRRAAKTAIGKPASAKHWFVDIAGPWSERESAAHAAMLQELTATAEPTEPPR